MIKKGLVLEGGAMRGLFTAGVMDVLMENGISFDGAVGVSAGAAFGVNYKSGQIGRVLRYNTKFCSDKRYGGIGVLLKTGNLYSKDFCYGEVPLVHDVFDFSAYDKNPMEFYVVATDVENGRPVYHKYTGKEASGFEWIRASASMPLVSEIVEIDGQKLLDGGVSDSVPLKFFQNMGYEKNVVILTQPKNYRKKVNKALPLIKLLYKKYPEFVKTAANRHIEYNNTLDYIMQEEKNGRVLAIRPYEALPIGRVEKDPEKLKVVYELGRKVATDRLSEIKEFLKN